MEKTTEDFTAFDNIDLRDYLDAIWMQKQFDDMLVMHANVKQALTGNNKFNPKFLAQRDKLAHDIDVLQPKLSEAGLKVAHYIEKKYGIEFWIIRQAPPEQKTPMIISPGEEKT